MLANSWQQAVTAKESGTGKHTRHTHTTPTASCSSSSQQECTHDLLLVQLIKQQANKLQFSTNLTIIPVLQPQEISMKSSNAALLL